MVPDALEPEPVDEPDPELELEPEPELPPAPVELLPVAGLFFFIPAASSVEVPPDIPEEPLCELPDPVALDDIETPNALAVLLSIFPGA